MVDRYEHTYRYKKVTNNDNGEIMLVLKAMRIVGKEKLKILYF